MHRDVGEGHLTYVMELFGGMKKDKWSQNVG